MARFWVIGLVVYLVALPAAWANPPRFVVDQASRAEGERLLSVISPEGPFQLIQATSREFAFGIGSPGGRPKGILHLNRHPNSNIPRFHSRTYAMDVSNFTNDLAITDRLIHAANLVAAQDGGGRSVPTQQIRPDLEPLRNVIGAVVVLAALLRFIRQGKITWEVRLPHLIPAIIQVVLFTYWSVYWPSIRTQIPVILQQLALAFALDATLSFVRFGSWRIGASPLPIVLSTNLFVWFGTYGIILSTFVAFFSKFFVLHKGRHIFNPSALGLSITGLVSYLFPGFTSVGGLFHTMNLPPNMAELVLLLALLPQIRFRILPVTIAAMLALISLQYDADVSSVRPPILLAFALLATDPSTVPVTDIGKVLFGTLLGSGLVFLSWELRTHGQIDDFAKVMPIPVANALVPVFDQIGRTLTTGMKRFFLWLWDVPAPTQTTPAMERFRRFSLTTSNLAFVAFWLLLTTGRLRQGKPESFETALHWNYGTPLVVRDADDVPRCAHNPIFCQPFTFAREIAAWRGRSHAR